MEKPELFKNLEVYESLTNIILENGTKLHKDASYIILKKDILSSVKDYLEQGDPMYSTLFKIINDEGRIKFDRKRANRYDSKKQIINLNYTRTIEDIYNLIYMFYVYASSSNRDDAFSKTFSKVIPNTEELKASRYFSNLTPEYKKDTLKHVNNNFSEFYETAENAKNELELYKKYLENPSFNIYNLPDYLYKYSLDRIFLTEAGIDNYGQYLFGFIISTYLNHRLATSDLSQSDYMTLKEKILKLDMKDISKILDIDFNLDNGLHISNNDIDKLSKIYKLEFNKYNEK